MRRRMRAVRAFGWQLDYRPDGWLPLGVREGWPGWRWHVLPLGGFGCVTLGRVSGPGVVTVTLTADTTALEEGIARIRARMDELTREAASVQVYRHRLAMERLAGLAYVGQLLDGFARDVGLAGRGHCGQERQCSLMSGGCACGREVMAELTAGDDR